MSAPAPEAQWIEQTSVLEIHFQQMLGYECTLRVAAWQEQLIAVSQIEGELNRIDVSDIGDWILDSGEEAICNWRSLVPPDVHRAVRQLPGSKLTALSLSARVPPARDLLVSNPILFWLWLSSFNGRPTPESLEQLGFKQRRLLSVLVGLDGNQQCRILRKASSSCLSQSAIELLVGCMRDEEICKFLAHQQIIKEEGLRALSDYPWLVTMPAKALIPMLSERQVLRWFRDVLQMLPRQGLSRLGQCASVGQLERLHDRLVAELNRNRRNRLILIDELGEPYTLPPPPALGNERICYLASQKEIVEEGRQMHHCIASYLRRCVDGDYYVYRMTEPERLTIGVKRTNGRFNVDDVKGACNKEPSVRDMELIMAWWEKNLKA